MSRKAETKMIAEFSIVPIGQKDTSLGPWVAEALKAISGVDGIEYELTPMGTIIEAEGMGPIFEAVSAAHESLVRKGANRILSTLRIDDRRDKPRTMLEKVESVRKYVGNL